MTVTFDGSGTGDRPLFLVDTSVMQRLRIPAIAEAFARLRKEGKVTSCLPALLEEGFSARSAIEHDLLLRDLAEGKGLLSPARGVVRIALELQSALFHAGKGRAVGVSDLEIAATAIHHSTDERPVVVVHYDADFDHVASVEPRLHTRWIVPRGSLEVE